MPNIPRGGTDGKGSHAAMIVRLADRQVTRSQTSEANSAQMATMVTSASRATCRISRGSLVITVT